MIADKQLKTRAGVFQAGMNIEHAPLHKIGGRVWPGEARVNVPAYSVGLGKNEPQYKRQKSAYHFNVVCHS